MLENVIYISYPIPSHNHFGLKLLGKKYKERFDDICQREFYKDKSWEAFWQCNEPDFLYIEFLINPNKENEDKTIKKGIEIAKELNIGCISLNQKQFTHYIPIPEEAENG